MSLHIKFDSPRPDGYGQEDFLSFHKMDLIYSTAKAAQT